MEEQDRTLLQHLLTDCRVATLAVQIDGAPFASLVPFAMTDGNGAALIHASGLARHSAGLTSEAPYSLLIHQPDSQPETNPAQLARITLQGLVEILDKDSETYERARQRYLDKFPKSQITFQLGDFNLYSLSVESCRCVAGFGKAFDVEPGELAELS